METRIPAIAVVQRSFGNTRELEGIRVDAGTRFAVGKPIDGLRMISEERYRQLLRVRLVRPYFEEGAEPIAEHQAEAAAPPSPRVRPTKPGAAETRARDPEPPAPKRLDNPAAPPPPSPPDGSPTGEPVDASLSPVDQASSTSNTSSRKRARKTRASAG